MESRGYRPFTHRGVSVGQTRVSLITLIMGLLHEATFLLPDRVRVRALTSGATAAPT